MTPQWKSLLDQFDQAWQEGAAPRIPDFLARLPSPTPSQRRQFLEELIKIDLEYRWRRRTASDVAPCRLEDYLTPYPDLGIADELSVELIGWEYLVRQRFGDQPTIADYALRFPRQGTALVAELEKVQAELAAEAESRAPRGGAGACRLGLAGTETVLPPPATAPPVTPLRSVGELLASLRQSPLLTAAQLDLLSRLRFSEPRALARDLLQRNWLTPYQVNQFLQGRGADLVLGPYVLLERLGEGGAGQVFKARHQRLNRLVALKVIRKDLLHDAEAVRRFYREIAVVSRLDHPHIVHALDAGPTGTTHVLAMEFVEGTDLGKLVKQRGRLPIPQACTYIRQAALGLQYAHERGLVHRDIKPSNLILAKSAPGQEPVVKLLDMGLARLRGGPETALAPHGELTTTLTPVGGVVMMGTPDYLAPEQALDFHGADIRADIYSLGCTLYYLLTGQPPFPGGTLPQKLVRHQRSEPPPIQQFRRDVPSELDQVLRRMLAKDPADRYSTPADVAAALKEVLDGVAWRRALFRRQWRRGLLAAGLLGALLVSGLLAWSLVFRPTDSQFPVTPLPFSGRHEGPVRAVVFDPAGQLVSLGDDRVVRLWDPSAGRPRGAIRAKEKFPGLLGVALAPDGRTFVAISKSDESVAKIWNLATDQELETLRNHQVGNTRQPALSSGARMYAGIYVSGREVRVTNVATKRYLSITPGHDGKRINAVAFSPDSWLLATGGDDQMARLWDTNTARQRQVFVGHAAAVTALAFSPDGAILATGSDDQTVKLWDVPDGSLRRMLTGPAGRIHALAFSADGAMLASASSDASVQLWDVVNGRLHAVLRGHVGPVLAVTFAPNGATLASGGEDQTVRLWRLGR
jgi:serine/threonine protein kinase